MLAMHVSRLSWKWSELPAKRYGSQGIIAMDALAAESDPAAEVAVTGHGDWTSSAPENQRHAPRDR